MTSYGVRRLVITCYGLVGIYGGTALVGNSLLSAEIMEQAHTDWIG